MCALKSEREGREGGGRGGGGGREGGRESESERASERERPAVYAEVCEALEPINPLQKYPKPSQHSAFSLKPKAYADNEASQHSAFSLKPKAYTQTMRRWIHTYKHTYKSAFSIQAKA